MSNSGAVEIETLGELMRAISQATFGGYDLQVEITQEHSDGGFLLVSVSAHTEADADVIENYVGQPRMWGQFWFDANDQVMQVM